MTRPFATAAGGSGILANSELIYRDKVLEQGMTLEAEETRSGPMRVMVHFISTRRTNSGRTVRWSGHSTTSPSAWNGPMTIFTRSPGLTVRRGLENAIQKFLPAIGVLLWRS